MRLVLGVATVVSVVGVMDSFGMFYLGDHVFHLDRALIQTLMYLKLSVAGHFPKFSSRGRAARSGPSVRADSAGGGVRHANRGDAGRGLWIVHSRPSAGVGRSWCGVTHWHGSLSTTA